MITFVTELWYACYTRKIVHWIRACPSKFQCEGQSVWSRCKSYDVQFFFNLLFRKSHFSIALGANCIWLELISNFQLFCTSCFFIIHRAMTALSNRSEEKEVFYIAGNLYKFSWKDHVISYVSFLTSGIILATYTKWNRGQGVIERQGIRVYWTEWCRSIRTYACTFTVSNLNPVCILSAIYCNLVLLTQNISTMLLS